jgi:predicted PurR-regulated permease PerM
MVAGIPGALFAVPMAAFVNVFAVYLSRRAWKTGERPDSDVLIWSTVPRPRRRRA